jgi:uncharacterized protein
VGPGAAGPGAYAGLALILGSMSPQRSGSADLPLHAGRVPQWLAVRMAALGRVIVEAIVQEYGRAEILRRLADPFWFQSFGAVMGMDWHSSGITTSVVGALKRGLAPVQRELGLYVCGGKGVRARGTPQELETVGELTGVDAGALIRASRLVAKIDSAAVQDGFDLYLHAFFATAEGAWCVVQQGMNEGQREARRYHWRSEGLEDFFDSPHAGIEGRNVGLILNLADTRAECSRRSGLELVSGGPDRTVSVLRRQRDRGTLDLFAQLDTADAQAAAATAPTPTVPLTELPHLVLPHRHPVRATDVVLRRLHAALAAAAERGPRDFAELLLTPGVGARTVATLAFVAEIIHGAPCRFSDPARFAFALGGKDGHPFPVPLDVYDETLRVLKRAVARARLGRHETLAAIRRIDRQARALEDRAAGPSFEVLAAARGRAGVARAG